VPKPKTLAAAWLGRIEYRQAWDLQGQAVEAVRSGERPPGLLLLEHPHVFTMGRGARPENLIWDEAERVERQVDLVWVDRGGDATYHGPGQLVGYPIVDLRSLDLDVLGFLRALERSLIAFAGTLGVTAQPGDRDHIGVWVGEEKLAAIGVKVTGGVTSHGFALNLTPDLAYFGGIVPCGLPDRGVTSLERLGLQGLDMAQAAAAYAPLLAAELGLRLEWAAQTPPINSASPVEMAFRVATG
jgi:lipoate-protein ligase B